MARQPSRAGRSRILLAAALTLVALASPGSAANEVASGELRGACYCRAKDELMCTANLTGRECELRSRHAFCDDWFWKERLPCWNWGYGG